MDRQPHATLTRLHPMRFMLDCSCGATATLAEVPVVWQCGDCKQAYQIRSCDYVAREPRRRVA